MFLARIQNLYVAPAVIKLLGTVYVVVRTFMMVVSGSLPEALSHCSSYPVTSALPLSGEVRALQVRVIEL